MFFSGISFSSPPLPPNKRKYVDRRSGIRPYHPKAISIISILMNFFCYILLGFVLSGFVLLVGWLVGYCCCHYGCCFWMFDSSCVSFDVWLTFSRGGGGEKEEGERPSKAPVH